jgi:hypothetical protein
LPVEKPGQELAPGEDEKKNKKFKISKKSKG